LTASLLICAEVQPIISTSASITVRLV